MTSAWYGHLKYTTMPLWKAIAISWGIAFFEYCLMVPANRFGLQMALMGYFSPFYKVWLYQFSFSHFKILH